MQTLQGGLCIKFIQLQDRVYRHVISIEQENGKMEDAEFFTLNGEQVNWLFLGI